MPGEVHGCGSEKRNRDSHLLPHSSLSSLPLPPSLSSLSSPSDLLHGQGSRQARAHRGGQEWTVYRVLCYRVLHTSVLLCSFSLGIDLYLFRPQSSSVNTVLTQCWPKGPQAADWSRKHAGQVPGESSRPYRDEMTHSSSRVILEH